MKNQDNNPTSRNDMAKQKKLKNQKAKSKLKTKNDKIVNKKKQLRIQLTQTALLKKEERNINKQLKMETKQMKKKERDDKKKKKIKERDDKKKKKIKERDDKKKKRDDKKKVKLFLKKYEDVFDNSNYTEFKGKLNEIIRINNDSKINEKLFKIYHKKNDENLYNEIHFDYDEKPFNEIAEHLSDKFKTDNFSIINVNKILKEYIDKFRTPYYKKMIRYEFKELKAKIKMENLKEKNLIKGVNFKYKQTKELKKEIKGDYNDDKVGANEMTMHYTGLTNLPDDKIKNKKNSNK